MGVPPSWHCCCPLWCSWHHCHLLLIVLTCSVDPLHEQGLLLWGPSWFCHLIWHCCMPCLLPCHGSCFVNMLVHTFSVLLRGQCVLVLILVVWVGWVSVSSPWWLFHPIHGHLCLALVPCPYCLAWAGCCCCCLSSWWWLILCLCLCGHNCVTSFCLVLLPFLVIHASVLCHVILSIYLVLLIPWCCCMVHVLFCLSPIGHQIVLSCLGACDQQLSWCSIPFWDHCQSCRRMLLPCLGKRVLLFSMARCNTCTWLSSDCIWQQWVSHLGLLVLWIFGHCTLCWSHISVLMLISLETFVSQNLHLFPHSFHIAYHHSLVPL